MTGRRVIAVLIIVGFVVLAVEGYLYYEHLDRYYNRAASGVGTQTTEDESGDAESPEPPEDARTVGEDTVVHRATDGNSRGDFTYLSDPRIDGERNAVILAEPSGGGARSGSAPYGHNIGVWFEARTKQKWAVFNQDLAAVPAGATFEMVVPARDEAFVHRARSTNIVGNTTYLDDSLTNGEPGVTVSVTQNWNPGGNGGVYNDHPVSALYDQDVDQWFVFNEDGARMPDRSAFNVAVSKGARPAE